MVDISSSLFFIAGKGEEYQPIQKENKEMPGFIEKDGQENKLKQPVNRLPEWSVSTPTTG
jgi:hypothetical protein